MVTYHSFGGYNLTYRVTFTYYDSLWLSKVPVLTPLAAIFQAKDAGDAVEAQDATEAPCRCYQRWPTVWESDDWKGFPAISMVVTLWKTIEIVGEALKILILSRSTSDFYA